MFPLPTAYLASPPVSHSRSVSLGPPAKDSPYSSHSRAKSTTDINAMAADGLAFTIPQDGVAQEGSFRTLADPRNTSTSDVSRSGSVSLSHSDVSPEVTTLNDKLVSAIEHNTSLDETLAQTRRELEASRARIAELEAEAKSHTQKLKSGDLFTKEETEETKNKLNAELAEERKQKNIVLQEKRGIELELETLTASLFDEANRMVAAANKQRDATEKKNQQLRDQIKDGEALVASQAEQLTELKVLMQSIDADYRKEFDSPRTSLDPSSPALGREESNLAQFLEAINFTPVSANGEVVPTPSTSLTHLLKPVCRTDVPAYDDFRNLLQTSFNRSHNPSHTPSRAGSGNYGGLNVMGLTMANGSNPNLSQVTQPATSKLANTPSIPGAFSPSPDVKGPVPLKDTRFFKRILAEDVEPTLRLDLSPTISWLNRRSILAALTDSALVVEPIPEASIRLYGKYTPCALCGESRREDENPRTHAMRAREGEGATKWSICKLCLEKVRGVGDLIAYIRMIREGVVKCGDMKEEQEVWEELVRLRERLFWARMSGGVVPAFLPSTKTSPTVVEEKPEEKSEEVSDTIKDDVSSTNAINTESGVANTSNDEEPKNNDVQIQLPNIPNESLTTFEDLKEKPAITTGAGESTPPSTPPIRKAASNSAFPKISIPKFPDSFWVGQVNTLH